jgi:hypothetical protein
MPRYRLHLLDDGGHLKTAPVEFAAEDDAKAKAEAMEQAKGQRAELWERGRQHGRSQSILGRSSSNAEA